MTPFGKTKLVQAGFPATRIVIVPNPARVNEVTARPSSSKYVAFAGRVNAEKGVDVLLAAAAQMPSVCFKIAGDGPLLQSLASEAPANIEFLGQLGADQLSEFYRRSRVLVVPSICLETFGMVVAEAMACGVPVIASRIGGLPSVVDDGVTGLLFEPGNSTALVGELQRLWNDPALADQMGAAGREKALREYSERTYYESLMTTYRAAIQNGKNSPQSTPLVQLA
jgi:glycosyltransferase involved in cell wall biosynthesis